MPDIHQVDIVPRSTWEPLLQEALAPLSPAGRDTACAILEQLHNRHIGISISLTTQLIPWLEAGDQKVPKLAGWGNVVQRLSNELDHPHLARIGLLLSTAPTYTVFRLVQPILSEACRRLGQSRLFAEDNKASCSSKTYAHYSRDLLQQVVHMADDTSDTELALFWQERAFNLAGLSAAPGRATSSLPATDPLHGACFFELPEANESPSRARLRLRSQSASNERRGRAQQEGVAGIRVAHGLDQIHGMLQSEYMNPPLLLADRIANTGYLAYERHAHRESLRHLKLITLLPPTLARQPTGAFVKSAWYHFAARSAWLLCQQTLRKSDYIWVEGDALARIRSLRRHLADLPRIPRDTPCDARFRRTFTHSLRWLPDFLDLRGGTPSRLSPDQASRPEGLRLWLQAALDEVQSRYAEPANDQFGAVHVMLLLPGGQGLGSAPARALAKELRQELELGSEHANLSLSITRVPARLDDLAAWDIGASHDTREASDRPELANTATDGVHDWLQRRWMQTLRGALNGG